MERYEFFEFLAEEQYGSLPKIGDKRTPGICTGQNGNLSLATEAQIWLSGGIETLPASNLITHIASDNAGDTQVIRVQGYTLAGGLFTAVTQDVTLAGQTKTALPTALARITNAWVTGTTGLAGTVKIAQDVVFTLGVPASDVHATITATKNQTYKAVLTTASDEFWFLEEIALSIGRAAQGVVDFHVQVRKPGELFFTVLDLTLNSGATPVYLRPQCPIIVPPNSDVRVLGTSSANSMVADVRLCGPLGIVK